MTGRAMQVFRLYRIFADDGALLYIGESNDTLRRWLEHLRTKRWAAEIADIRRDPRIFYSKADVQAAEKAAVKRERPRFNDEYNKGNSNRVDPETMRYPDGRLYRPEVYHRGGAGSPPARGQRRAPGRPGGSAQRPSRRPAAKRRQVTPAGMRATGYLMLWLVVAGIFWWVAAQRHPLHGWQGPSSGAMWASGLFVVAWLTSGGKRRRK